MNYKKGALDSQPQVIKFASCLPMVGDSHRGTLASSTTKTGCHNIAEILLKVVLNTQKSISQSIKCLKPYSFEMVNVSIPKMELDQSFVTTKEELCL